LTGGLVWIVGKGSTEREAITLPAPTAQALSAWLKVRGTNQGPLFCNVDRARQGNGRLTGRGLHKICRLHGFRPHGLRHLAITEALDLTNGDARAVKRFSRHSRIETVLIYDDNRQDLGGNIARMIAGETP
jgi:integrase/recombinase XerC